SSRRRHTRCLSDWSSDVCSSDLTPLAMMPSAPASGGHAGVRNRTDGSALRRVEMAFALGALLRIDDVHVVLESNGRVRTFELAGDRKSTRLNSSHLGISYAVFCL